MLSCCFCHLYFRCVSHVISIERSMLIIHEYEYLLLVLLLFLSLFRNLRQLSMCDLFCLRLTHTTNTMPNYWIEYVLISTYYFGIVREFERKKTIAAFSIRFHYFSHFRKTNEDAGEEEEEEKGAYSAKLRTILFDEMITLKMCGFVDFTICLRKFACGIFICKKSDK